MFYACDWGLALCGVSDVMVCVMFSTGEYVIVGGDRGEDLGMVVHTWVAPAQDGNRTNSPGGGGSTNGNSVQYDNFGNPCMFISLTLPRGRVG